MYQTGVRGYVGHFFQCQRCAMHFLQMANAADTRDVRGRRDCALWMWEAHNKVSLGGVAVAEIRLLMKLKLGFLCSRD